MSLVQNVIYLLSNTTRSPTLQIQTPVSCRQTNTWEVVPTGFQQWNKLKASYQITQVQESHYVGIPWIILFALVMQNAVIDFHLNALHKSEPWYQVLLLTIGKLILL